MVYLLLLTVVKLHYRFIQPVFEETIKVNGFRVQVKGEIFKRS